MRPNTRFNLIGSIITVMALDIFSLTLWMLKNPSDNEDPESERDLTTLSRD